MPTKSGMQNRRYATYAAHEELQTQNNPRQICSGEIKEPHKAHADIRAAFGPYVEDGVGKNGPEEWRRFPRGDAVVVEEGADSLLKEAILSVRVRNLPNSSRYENVRATRRRRRSTA